MKSYAAYAIGAALVDTEIQVTDAELAELNVEKGMMTLVDQARQHDMLTTLSDHLIRVDLIAGHLKGMVSTEALAEASRERPEAVDELILDTRSFLRGQADWLPDEDAAPPAEAPD